MESRAPGGPWPPAQPSDDGDGMDGNLQSEVGSTVQRSDDTEQVSIAYTHLLHPLLPTDAPLRSLEQPAPDAGASGSFVGAPEETSSAASLSGFSGERAGR